MRASLTSVGTGGSQTMSACHLGQRSPLQLLPLFLSWWCWHDNSMHFWSEKGSVLIVILNIVANFSCTFDFLFEACFRKWRKSHSLDFYCFDTFFYEGVSLWLVVQLLQWHWHLYIGAINTSISCPLDKSWLLEILWLTYLPQDVPAMRK